MLSGADTRRRWSEETKARIVAESFAQDAVVSQVARRHGLRPQQLFDWRRELRAQWRQVTAVVEMPAFVPAVMEEAAAAPLSAVAIPSGIEIEAGQFVLRLRGEVDGQTLATVLRAMKAATS